jgi:hypothetical protein
MLMLDTQAQSLFDKNISMKVPWYLMASYAYYVEDNPILSDAFFDNMSKVMLDDWMNIHHFHKDYLSIDTLTAGTFIGDYPSRVQGGLESLRDKYGQR